jgi:hypothetical protein
MKKDDIKVKGWIETLSIHVSLSCAWEFADGHWEPTNKQRYQEENKYKPQLNWINALV